MMYLKKLVVKSSIIILLITFWSCNSLNYKMRKNEKNTERIANKIFLQNKNVFIISHSIANYSYVFTYLNNNEIEWTKIVNGRIDNTQKVKTMVNLNDFQEVFFEDYIECEAWDYSYLNLKFYSDKKLIDYSFSIDPNCFIKSESRNDFLKNIKVDIENYKKVDNSLYH